jgi:tripartite-type tricarboxylate transporter receptor subunit TctC
MAAPKGLNAEARDKLAAAFKKIVASKEYNDFMSAARLRRHLRAARGVRVVHGKSDADLGATMKAVGIVK